MEMVTPGQAASLAKRVVATGSNMKAFLIYAGAKTFDEIPAVKYEHLDALLKLKRKPKKEVKTMNISGLKQSNFLTRADVGKGMLVTIKGDIFQENVAQQGAPEELRYCLAFHECEKPMVLNITNGQLIAKITGSEESSTWDGQKLVLFDDPTVSFGGKLVGGIRVRVPRRPVQSNPIKPVPSVAELPTQAEDDVPF